MYLVKEMFGPTLQGEGAHAGRPCVFLRFAACNLECPWCDTDFAAEGAVKLDALSHEPWKHFPSVREEDHTSAKDDVWQQQARFQELARNLEAATGELVIASQVQPYKASNLGPAVQKVEDACTACHKQFRDH